MVREVQVTEYGSRKRFDVDCLNGGLAVRSDYGSRGITPLAAATLAADRLGWHLAPGEPERTTKGTQVVYVWQASIGKGTA